MNYGKIEEYKDCFMEFIPENEDDILNSVYALITENETMQKQMKALENVNDAYEYGDYTRSDWLRRKKKWEDSIHQTRNTLYELRRQAKSTVRITNTDRQAMLSDFFNNITHSTDQSERNDLYRIIIDRIIWSKDGDDIKVSINFK